MEQKIIKLVYFLCVPIVVVGEFVVWVIRTKSLNPSLFVF